PDAPGLRGALGSGSEHWQRVGGGEHQAGSELATEADGGAVACGARRPPGGADRPGRYPRLATLLGHRWLNLVPKSKGAPTSCAALHAVVVWYTLLLIPLPARRGGMVARPGGPRTLSKGRRPMRAVRQFLRTYRLPLIAVALAALHSLLF